MTLTRFYRAAMLLPLLLPILVWPFALESFVLAAIWFSLFIGGPGYAAFYIVVFWLLGRLNSDRATVRLVWISPLLFIPFQLAAVVLYFVYSKIKDPSVQWDFWMLSAFVAYDLIFGYTYVLVVEGLRKLVFRLPRDPNVRSNNRLQGDGSPAARRA